MRKFKQRERDDYITVKQAAKEFGVSVATIHGMAHSDKIACIFVGSGGRSNETGIGGRVLRQNLVSRGDVAKCVQAKREREATARVEDTHFLVLRDNHRVRRSKLTGRIYKTLFKNMISSAS